MNEQPRSAFSHQVYQSTALRSGMRLLLKYTEKVAEKKTDLPALICLFLRILHFCHCISPPHSCPDSPLSFKPQSRLSLMSVFSLSPSLSLPNALPLTNYSLRLRVSRCECESEREIGLMLLNSLTSLGSSRRVWSWRIRFLTTSLCLPRPSRSPVNAAV